MKVTATAVVNPRLADLPKLAKLDADDMARMAVTIDARFRRNEAALFASEGSSGGDPWAPLSAAYAAQKARRFPGRKILNRTGDLRRSLTTKNAEHIAHGYVLPKPTVVVGTSSRVGTYHAPGALHNPNLPVRDPIQTTQAQFREYQQVIRDALLVKLKRLAVVMQAAFRIKAA